MKIPNNTLTPACPPAIAFFFFQKKIHVANVSESWTDTHHLSRIRRLELLSFLSALSGHCAQESMEQTVLAMYAGAESQGADNWRLW
jgi:hypothetical protein